MSVWLDLNPLYFIRYLCLIKNDLRTSLILYHINLMFQRNLFHVSTNKKELCACSIIISIGIVLPLNYRPLLLFYVANIWLIFETCNFLLLKSDNKLIFFICSSFIIFFTMQIYYLFLFSATFYY